MAIPDFVIGALENVIGVGGVAKHYPVQTETSFIQTLQSVLGELNSERKGQAHNNTIDWAGYIDTINGIVNQRIDYINNMKAAAQYQR